MIEAELESLFDLREPRSISRTSVKLSALVSVVILALMKARHFMS